MLWQQVIVQKICISFKVQMPDQLTEATGYMDLIGQHSKPPDHSTKFNLLCCDISQPDVTSERGNRRKVCRKLPNNFLCSDLRLSVTGVVEQTLQSAVSVCCVDFVAMLFLLLCSLSQVLLLLHQVCQILRIGLTISQGYQDRVHPLSFKSLSKLLMASRSFGLRPQFLCLPVALFSLRCKVCSFLFLLASSPTKP